jgi:catalase
MKSNQLLPKALKMSGLALGVALAVSVQAQEAPSADQVVNALEKLGGVYPGERRNHIIGICANGVFVGSKDAQGFSRSALFSGDAIPVVGRFSLAGGNPKAPDSAKSPRGMALEFKLPGNNLHRKHPANPTSQERHL